MTCLSAALTTLREYNRVRLMDVSVLWAIPAYTIAACLIVIMDLLHRHQYTVEDYETQKLVEQAILGLSQSEHNKMAARGVFILKALLEEGEARRRGGFQESISTHLSRVERRLNENSLKEVSYDKDTEEVRQESGHLRVGDSLGTTGIHTHLNQSSLQLTDDDYLQMFMDESLYQRQSEDIFSESLQRMSFSSYYGSDYRNI